ncbi:Acyl transferase/acyl hydrolase/lysophospholipase [Penicillium odoratum]|uniref:Acyl transferase/acyl hydrolase/lysophospholipase n=1 Tax=Penicillium odoratum TaxID=1167516 RepID=UPI0025496649|nr:Acyl transferase/acyl hydrolase/lysophospholipase [Penicillium odoratum]KAJ5753205.1 Acyl transferase/acyl hydrolase/lysophospholipase [Penicillium odoratum]
MSLIPQKNSDIAHSPTMIYSAVKSSTLRRVRPLSGRHSTFLLDHKIGTDIVFPTAGFCAMAIEAIYQCTQMTLPVEGVTRAGQIRYRLRNIRFDKALILEEGVPAKLTITLSPHPRTKNS